MLKRWSTKDVPAHAARDYWIALMRELIFKAPIDLPEDSTLEAAYAQASCGVLRVGWVDSPARRVILPAAATESINPHGDVQITLMDTSAWSLVKGRTQWRLGRRDLLIANPHSSFDLRREQRTRTTCAFLPRAWLASWLPGLDLEDPVILSAESGWGKVLSALLSEITPERVAVLAGQAHLLDLQLGSLLALAFHERDPRHNLVLEASKLLLVAKACVRRRFGECGLTAADVAAESGMSERTLRRVFALHDESFTEALNAERMAAAHRLVSDRNYLKLPIAAIARRVGFGDASHFIRKFKQTFGMTPLAMRRQARANHPDPACEVVHERLE